MPFTYPPSSSGAQMTPEQATGLAASVAERKPSDADGEPKQEGDDSDPVLHQYSLCFYVCFTCMLGALQASLLSILLAMST